MNTVMRKDSEWSQSMICMVGWVHPFVRREALPVEVKIRYDIISSSVKKHPR